MMRSSIYRGAFVAIAFAVAAPLASAGDVSVGVTISGEITPGVYGRVDLSNRPPPPLVYARPIVIEQPAPRIVYEPIYLHVPPGHAKNWRKHCHEYRACNRPVYFVRSAEYEPGYQRDDHDDHGKHGERDHHDHGRH
jgi:hypothetical protein